MLQIKLNRHMVKKRIWEETDEIIERPPKRRSFRRLSRVASNQKQAKKRKRSNIISESRSDETSILGKDCLAAQTQKKQKKNQGKVKNEVSNLDLVFQKAMKKEHKFEICEVAEMIITFFRAFAHQLYADQRLHGVIRDRCCRYLELYRERFQSMVNTETINCDFSHYLNRMRTFQTRGGKLEMLAISDVYERQMEVYAGKFQEL